MTEQEQLIANQADLEAFVRQPAGERQVTDRLKGVLAETAVTGVIRYPWPLLQPLLSHLMQEQLAKYEAEEHVEIGPARPILDGSSDGSVQQLAERFSQMLSGFESHPWTLQRLCELLLEPQKQYKRLHKLALAIEKLLLVTGELSVSEQLGPPPPLSQLTRINEAPPAPAAAAGSNANARQGDSDGGGLLAVALEIRQQQQPQQAAAGAPAAAANAVGDAPAAAAAPAGDAVGEPMQVDTPAAAAAAAAAEAAAAPTGGDAPAEAAAANGGTDNASMETESPADPAAAPAAAAAATAPAAAAAAAPAAAAADDTEMAS